MNQPNPRRSRSGSKHLIVAITGATGVLYGVRILKQLALQPDWTSHVIVSDAGGLNAWQEQQMRRKDLEDLADVVHNPRNIGASIASGSFLTEGMIVAPCSMKTLAAIAHGYSDNLIARAADVVLKERRRLVLVTREAPLHLVHLRNMTAVTEMGAIVFPPVPAFYGGAQSVDDLIDHTAGRVLDLFGIHAAGVKRWNGFAEGGRETTD